MHSGTLPCERLWANFSSLLPAEARLMSRPWWDLLNSLCYLRLNYAHFNRARHPTWCEGDPLLASNIDDLISMTQLLRKDALGQHPEVIAGLQQAFPKPD